MGNISWYDIERSANGLGLEPCVLYAVCQVEASGDGFLPDGRPKILFEPHVFWRELVKRRYNPEGLLKRDDVRRAHGDISDILYKNWGGRPYGSYSAQWGYLKRARAINEDAALCSASWGAFQIMGNNYGLCGFDTIQEFVAAMSSGYAGQLEALGCFVKVNNLIRSLKAHDWAVFARGYNGPGYAKNNYDTKLRQAYEKCVRGQ